MNGYPYSQPRAPYPQASNASMMDLSADGLGAFDMAHGQSLDDIVTSNDKANRRRSMPVYNGPPMQMASPDSRRFSSMNFGDPSNQTMEEFQFDISTAAMDGILSTASFPRSSAELQANGLPAADLAINTQFSSANPDSPFSTVPNPGSAYASPLQHNGSLDMALSPYPSSIPMPLDMLPADMNMFPSSAFGPSMMDSPVHQEFSPHPATTRDSSSNGNNNGNKTNNMTNKSIPMHPADHQYRSGSSNATPDTRPGGSTRHNSQDQNTMRSASRSQSETQSSSKGAAQQMSQASLKNQEPVQLPPGQELSQEQYDQASYTTAKFSWPAPPGGFPSTKDKNPHMKTQFKNAYSSTGFDMLGVLVSPSLCRSNHAS